MASLRARLVAAVLVLSAAGLLLLGVGDRAEHEQPDGGEHEDARDEPSAQGDDHVRGGLSE